MLEKLLLHYVASQLTNATVLNLPQQSATTQAQEAIVAQVQVDWYEWLRNVINSSAWPTPTIDPTWLVNVIKAGTGITTPPAAGTVPPLSQIAPVASKSVPYSPRDIK